MHWPIATDDDLNPIPGPPIEVLHYSADLVSQPCAIIHKSGCICVFLGGTCGGADCLPAGGHVSALPQLQPAKPGLPTTGVGAFRS